MQKSCKIFPFSNQYLRGYFNGRQAAKMEKEKPHAMEMGKEKAQAHEAKAKAKSRRALVLNSFPSYSHS